MVNKAEVIAKGARCKRLLEDEDLKQAFQDVRNAIHDKFEEVSSEDEKALVGLKQRLHILDSVKANLVKAIQDGKLESKALDEVNVRWLGDIHGRFSRRK